MLGIVTALALNVLLNGARQTPPTAEHLAQSPAA
jgi:hypothetical protein